ncbi:MAG: mechanosensitive ion channel [Planctomycetes bacterium]|nr:mechanosensitive ion channel [Planctomycetota bacterium]MBL7143195.1 mechanosensitive ion channel [Phycisphaerae bacterium]
MFASLENWERLALLLGAAGLIGITGHLLLYRLLLKISKSTTSNLDNTFIKFCYRPLQWIIILVVVRLLQKLTVFETQVPDFISHVMSLLLIGLVSWLLIRSVYVLEGYILRRFDVDVKDNLKARKIHTQFRVLKRIVIVVVAILAFGSCLMTFEKVQQLGTTILASAGIIGIVVGMAAQKTITTFIAGLQIAITQPIRVDDVVIVENEWGRIEEITLTYVVVRIWDLRRLIVPITFFIEKPFQNWTRVTADILGTVFIYVDYTVPIESVRTELRRILEESELWDRKVCVLQVTNTSERTVELRALMSAVDASTAWSLRCHVREKLIDFVQKNFPEALPKLRTELNRQKVDR